MLLATQRITEGLDAALIAFCTQAPLFTDFSGNFLNATASAGANVPQET